MNKENKTPLAERIQALTRPDSRPYAESLAVLSQRILFFFQGVAALTGMRCYRENLDCWLRWEALDAQSGLEKENNFLSWLAFGGRDLMEENDEEIFTNLLLEPMYWLEECAKAQETESLRLRGPYRPGKDA